MVFDTRDRKGTAPSKGPKPPEAGPRALHSMELKVISISFYSLISSDSKSDNLETFILFL
jgi:hypothetical protein